MTTAIMRKVRKSPSPNDTTHLAEQKWDWSYAMLLGIWRMLRRAGVSREEIVEKVTRYLEACNRSGNP